MKVALNATMIRTPAKDDPQTPTENHRRLDFIVSAGADGLKPAAHLKPVRQRMPTLDEEYFRECVEKLRHEDDSAIHCLMKMPTDLVIPLATNAFRTEEDATMREALVHIVWQQRCSEAVPLMAEAIHDTDPRVWKEAIDGLVTLALPESQIVLEKARSVRPNRSTGGKYSFLEWVDDALQQLASLKSPGHT